MKFQIRVQPNSGRQEIQTSIDGKIIKVFLKKPAKDNKANNELEKFLSKYLKKQVKIIKGHTSKNKTIEILSWQLNIIRLLTFNKSPKRL